MAMGPKYWTPGGRAGREGEGGTTDNKKRRPSEEEQLERKTREEIGGVNEVDGEEEEDAGWERW